MARTASSSQTIRFKIRKKRKEWEGKESKRRKEERTPKLERSK